MARSKSTEDPTIRKERARKVLNLLKKRYPEATTALRSKNPLQLLVATILSAQCTDVRVNEVTGELFKTYRTAADYADADIAEFEQAIRSTGFFRQKTKAITRACRTIMDNFGGHVPSTMDELTSLPGVARKTANVVLGAAFGKNEGIAVDTHVGRVAVRLQLAPSAKGPKDADAIEKDLMKIVSRQNWTFFSYGMILFGRETCQARKPRHEQCMLLPICPTGQAEMGMGGVGSGRTAGDGPQHE